VNVLIEFFTWLWGMPEPHTWFEKKPLERSFPPAAAAWPVRVIVTGGLVLLALDSLVYVMFRRVFRRRAR
jgi:hypothetical protein